MAQEEKKYRIALIEDGIPPYPLSDFEKPANVSRAVKKLDKAGGYYEYEMSLDFAGHMVVQNSDINCDETGRISKVIPRRYCLLGNESIELLVPNKNGGNEWISIYPMERKLTSKAVMEDGGPVNDEKGNPKVEWSAKWVQLTEADIKK